MKLLADENIGFSIINPLRKLGYDISSIIEISPGLDDKKVLSIANKENRIIINNNFR